MKICNRCGRKFEESKCLKNPSGFGIVLDNGKEITFCRDCLIDEGFAEWIEKYAKEVGKNGESKVL